MTKHRTIEFLKMCYYDHYHFFIRNSIKYIRENKFPYQKDYWIADLKFYLNLKNKTAIQIMNFSESEAVQLELFSNTN